MKSAGKARNNGLYRHIRTSKEIIRNLLNDYTNYQKVPDKRTLDAAAPADWYCVLCNFGLPAIQYSHRHFICNNFAVRL